MYTSLTKFSDYKVTTQQFSHSTTPLCICSGGGNTTLIVLVDGGGVGVSVGDVVIGSVGTKILEHNVSFCAHK